MKEPGNITFKSNLDKQDILEVVMKTTYMYSSKYSTKRFVMILVSNFKRRNIDKVMYIITQ